MPDELDLTEILSAVERVQRGYRRPLPGTIGETQNERSGNGDPRNTTLGSPPPATPGKLGTLD